MAFNITHDKNKKEENKEHKPVVNKLSDKTEEMTDDVKTPESKTEEMVDYVKTAKPKTEEMTDDVKVPESKKPGMKKPTSFQIGAKAGIDYYNMPYEDYSKNSKTSANDLVADLAGTHNMNRKQIEDFLKKKGYKDDKGNIKKALDSYSFPAGGSAANPSSSPSAGAATSTSTPPDSKSYAAGFQEQIDESKKKEQEKKDLAGNEFYNNISEQLMINSNNTFSGGEWDGLEYLNDDKKINEMFESIDLMDENFQRDWLKGLYGEASTTAHKNDKVAEKAKEALKKLGEEPEPNELEKNRRREVYDNALNTVTVELSQNGGDISKCAVSDIKGAASAVQMDLMENPDDENAKAKMADLEKKVEESGDPALADAVTDGIAQAEELWKSLYAKNKEKIEKEYDPSIGQVSGSDGEPSDYGFDDLDGLETIMQGKDGEKKKEMIKNVNRHITELEERLKDPNLPEPEKQEIKNRIRDLKTQRDSCAEKIWLQVNDIAERADERGSMDDYIKKQRAGGISAYYKREKNNLKEQIKAAKEAGNDTKAKKLEEELDKLSKEKGYFYWDTFGTALKNLSSSLAGKSPDEASQWSQKQGDILKAETDRWNKHWDEQMKAIDADFSTRYGQQDAEMQAWNEIKNNYDLQMQAKHLGLLDKTFNAEAAIGMQKLLNTKNLNQTMQIMSIIGESDPEEMIFMLLGRSGLNLDNLVKQLGTVAQTIADTAAEHPEITAALMGLIGAGNALLGK